MATPQNGTIYTLTDPRDGQIRYVGQTKQTPLDRLAGHLASASNPAMRVWFNALALQGLTPRIDTIATPRLNQMDAEERRQIEEHAKAGHRLFNAPYYHRNIVDLYQAAAPAPSALKRDDVTAGKIDEYAHRVYGNIAAASVAGKISKVRTVVRVLALTPAVAAVVIWHALAGVPPIRWATKTTLIIWALWEVGFDRLAQDRVLPHMPLSEAAQFWNMYLQRPLMNLALAFAAAAVLTALMAYASVRESAEAKPRPSDAGRSNDPAAIAAAAAAALDAAVPHQRSDR